MTRLALVLTSAALLAACASAPESKRAQPSLPERFDNAAPASTTIAADWWTLFGDSTLTGLVETALQHNTDLQIAAARVDETATLLGLARAAQWPGLDLNASASRSRISTLNGSPAPASGPESTTHRLLLSSSFEIDLWGRLRHATAAAQAQLLAAEHARDAVRVGLVAAVAQSYFGLRAFDAQLALADAQVQSRRDSLKIVNQRVAAGVASALEQAQANSALAATLAQRPELQRQRALLANQIGLLTGQPGQTVAATASALTAPPQVPAGLPSDLLLRRPDIRASEAALLAADAQVQVARAAMWPTLSLTGLLGGQSADLVDLLKGGARIWSIGPSLLVPLFDGGRNAARSEQAQAQAEQAALGYRKAVQSAFREVADALASGVAATQQELENERLVIASGETLRIAQRRHEAGYSGYLEVLDAQRSVQESSLGLLQARQARLDAGVALIKALGGGWSTSPG